MGDRREQLDWGCLVTTSARAAYIALVGALVLCGASARADAYNDQGRNSLYGAFGGRWLSGSELASVQSVDWFVFAQPTFVHYVRDRIGVGFYLGYEIAAATHINVAAWERYDYKVHSLAAGPTFEWEYLRLGRVGLLFNLYVGFSQHVRRGRLHTNEPPDIPGPYSFSPPVYDGRARVPGSGGYVLDVRERESGVELGFRLPIVYHVTASVALGFGPNLLLSPWRVVTTNRTGKSTFESLRWGMSSYLAFSF